MRKSRLAISLLISFLIFSTLNLPSSAPVFASDIPASAARSEKMASPSNAAVLLSEKTASPSNADFFLKKNSGKAEGGGQTEDEAYTFCGYYFRYSDSPLELELGDEFDESLYLIPDTVELYLDGPNGHMEDSFTLNVEWDLSGVDFKKTGSYTVLGRLDKDGFPLPLDWEQVPPPAFTLNILPGGILSFQAYASGDTLVLRYRMNGEPITLSNRILSFYESRDGGDNWYDVSPSSRVQLSETQITVTGIRSDSLYQAVGLNLGGYYLGNSDIVEVAAADGEIRSVDILPSGGRKGGDSWNTAAGSLWHPYSFSAEDGPFQILSYKTGNRQLMPLKAQIPKGSPEMLDRDFFSTITVIYGDRSNGGWNERLLLPVQWDWSAADTIDWNQVGDTVIHGTFAQDTMAENAGLLDFEHMPELTLTVSVISAETPFILTEDWDTPFQNQTVLFQFYDDSYENLVFEDLSGLTVWCSGDGGLNWYDITGLSNVRLEGSSLSVSGLKNSILKDLGYSFEVEQCNRSDMGPYSTSLTVSHDIWGIDFSPPASGERGGGKRWPKPPEGLFDGTGPVPPITDSEPPIIAPEPPGADPVPPITGPEPPVTAPEPPSVNPESPVTDPEPPSVNPVPPGTGPDNGAGDNDKSSHNLSSRSENSIGSKNDSVIPDNTGSTVTNYCNSYDEDGGLGSRASSVTGSFSSDGTETGVPQNPLPGELPPLESPDISPAPDTIPADSNPVPPVLPGPSENPEATISVGAEPSHPQHAVLPLHKAFRGIIGISALLLGALVGFWMIRRR